MKGVIILPKYLKTLWTPKVGQDGLDFSAVKSALCPFYYAMRDAFGFELRYADEVDVTPEIDIVIMFGVPYHNRPKLIPGLLDLNKNIKLIMFPGDVQCYDNKLCLENKIKVFERCDLIVTTVYEYFVKVYPQFLSKLVFLPNFFSPQRYIQLPLNNNPKMRCLLSGYINPKVYPLRTFIKKKSQYVDYRKPKYLGDSYGELLHSYFCCVTSPTIFNYVVAKYFEIPASGSLLIARRCDDLDRVGFIPLRHYVPVTIDNVVTTIAQCIENPDDYNHIRREGMEYVRKNHGCDVRIKEMKNIIMEVVNA